MPKAAVDKHDGVITRQNDIRLARQIGAVQAKPEPLEMQPAPHEEFRLRVPPANFAHHAGAGLFVEYVRQAASLAGRGLVVQNESHFQDDSVLNRLAVLNHDLLALYPGLGDVVQGLRRSSDANGDGVLKGLGGGRDDFSNSCNGHRDSPLAL